MQFFFFHAEDGIRDYKVTGVQTCALPISGALVDRSRLRRARIRRRAVGQHVERECGVDWGRDVGVDERHSCPLRQWLACECLRLLTGELAVFLLLLGLVLTGASPSIVVGPLSR